MERPPRRRSIRLPDFDYSTPGAYFVTIVVQSRRALFGAIDGDEMSLSPAGVMVADHWQRLATRYRPVEPDVFVVMPNHVHGIIWLTEPAAGEGPFDPVPLSHVVRWFKTMTMNAYIRGVRELGWAPFDGRLWQRNYFERVIRNKRELRAARQHILDNPARWAEDHENPSRLPA